MTECRFFICFVVKLFFCDLNSSTTVEVDRGQDLHTTEVSGCDLLGLHTHVDQLVLYTLSTLVRKPHVVLRSTSSAVSITSNEDATVVLDSELSKSLHVYEVLQHSNLGLVQVEEHRDRSSDEVFYTLSNDGLHGLRSRLVAQTLDFSVCISKLCVQSVELCLAELLDSINIGNGIPIGLTKAVGQTNLSGEPVIVVLLVVATPYITFTLEVITTDVVVQVEVEFELVAQSPRVLDTSAEFQVPMCCKSSYVPYQDQHTE